IIRRLRAREQLVGGVQMTRVAPVAAVRLGTLVHLTVGRSIPFRVEPEHGELVPAPRGPGGHRRGRQGKSPGGGRSPAQEAAARDRPLIPLVLYQTLHTTPRLELRVRRSPQGAAPTLERSRRRCRDPRG